MRRFRNLIFAVLLSICTTASVNAASKCDTVKVAELNKEVVNVKVNHDILERTPVIGEEIVPPDWWEPEMGLDAIPKESYFRINILNLSENFYAEVTNDNTREKNTYTVNDAVDGVVSFDYYNVEEVTNFTIRIYTTDVTGCGKELFRTLYDTTPRFNAYSQLNLCEKIPDYYLCKPFVTYPDVESYVFYNNVEKQLAELEKQEQIEKENSSWIKKYGKYLIGGGVVVVVGTGVVLTIVIRNRRRRVI